MSSDRGRFENKPLKPRVWMANVEPLQDEALFDYYYAAMPPVRQRKIDRLRRAADRRLSLGAGVLLGEALRSQGLSLQQQHLASQEWGKDYLPEHPRLHFNLSHSGAEAMCILAPTEAGCDIQIQEPIDLQVAARFFAPEEYRLLLEQTDPDARQKLFFRLWTLKESFIKAQGQGLHRPLNSFSVCFTASGVHLQPEAEGRDHTLFELPAAEGYCAACCLKNHSGPAPQVHRVNLMSLTTRQERS